MADRSELPISRKAWKASDVAKASVISCGHCGARFETPHDFYAHLDTEHPKKGAKHGRRR